MNVKSENRRNMQTGKQTSPAQADVTIQRPALRWLFGGFGFQNAESRLTPLMTDEFRDQRALKSFRELSPSISRVYVGMDGESKESLDRFADYYDKTFRLCDTTIYAVGGAMPAFRRHGLDIRLAASDGSYGRRQVEELKWTVENMDPITGIYCTHYYDEGVAPGSPDAYGIFQEQFEGVVAPAALDKPVFVLNATGTGSLLVESDAPAAGDK